VPAFSGDHGALWRRQVLQLLCHASLSPGDLARSGAVLSAALAAAPPPPVR
jgi:hypothetical protein